MLTRIRASLPTLSKAEREVASWILDNPQQAIDGVIAHIAQQAGVSEPTIIRFCRSMGFNGFRDFKLALAQSLAGSTLSFCKDVSRDDSPAELINKIVGGAISSLQQVRNQLDRQEVEKAIRLVRDAERMEFYGQGGSGIVAADAQQKFFRFGKPCNVYTDPYIHGVAATLLDKNSVVVAISFSGRSTDILDSCRLAKKSGAMLIAITASGSPLAELADALLCVDIDEDSDHYAPIKSRMAQLVVLDVLSVGVALGDEQRLTGNLIEAKNAISNKYAP